MPVPKQSQGRKDKTVLTLADLALHQLPGDLHTYARLEHLDVSQNCLAALPGPLPPSLTRLTLTGNRLADLPALAALPRLKWLSAGANRLEAAGSLAGCPELQHAGLGFNRLAALELPAAALPALVSLDLTHNALCALRPLLTALAAGLPALRVLGLANNPLALRADYRSEVLAGLPALHFLDGADLRQPPAAPPPFSPPAPAPATAKRRAAGGKAAALAAADAPAAPRDLGGSRAPEATTVGIRLEVTGLALLEPALATLLAPRAGPPVAAPAPARGEAPAAAPGSAAAAPGSGPATPAAPRGAGRPGAPAQKDPAAAAGGLSGAAAAAPPARAGREPDPGPEPGLSPGPGAPWRCCVEVAGPGSELAASLPLLVGAAAAAAPEPGKGEAARGWAARAGGRDGSAKAAADRPPGGCLCATWRAAVAVPARDWLQGGLTLTLRATPAAADPAEAAEAARTLGSARFAAAALLDGATRGVAGAAGFASEPPLWDAAGRRLALADALAAVVQVATVNVRMLLLE